MMNFMTRFLSATFGALGAAALYGWLFVPELIGTAVAVVPFLLLSIVAFIYLQQTGAPKAASAAYLVGLFPFVIWIGAIILIFRNSPGCNDTMASILLISYLSAAAGAYLCLICFGRGAAQKRSGSC